LRDENRTFLSNKTSQGSERYSDCSWLAVVAHLPGVFAYLSGLNLSMQGGAVVLFEVQDKVGAMIMELDL
jgi:hypothetical protein